MQSGGSTEGSALTPEQIEEWRKFYQSKFDSAPVPQLQQAALEQIQLCELALDGLRFRVWCEGASTFNAPGICELATLLAKCNTPLMYREAIDKFIVMRAKAAA
jgi:hypothetical protein